MERDQANPVESLAIYAATPATPPFWRLKSYSCTLDFQTWVSPLACAETLRTSKVKPQNITEITEIPSQITSTLQEGLLTEKPVEESESLQRADFTAESD